MDFNQRGAAEESVTQSKNVMKIFEMVVMMEMKGVRGRKGKRDMEQESDTQRSRRVKWEFVQVCVWSQPQMDMYCIQAGLFQILPETNSKASF